MRLLHAALLSLAVMRTLPAPPVAVITIPALSKAPALVVAAVESAVTKEPVPAARWRSSTREVFREARLRIHRAPPSSAIAPGAAATLRSIGLHNRKQPVMGGPVYADFKTGETALFPLAPDPSIGWKLIAGEGLSLTLPALSVPPALAQPPQSGRALILAELAQALARGSGVKRKDVAAYLHFQSSWPEEFPALLEALLGPDEERRLDVAAALLASRGAPPQDINELIAQTSPRYGIR